MEFLRTSTRYDVSKILTKLKTSWLMEETIYLLVRANQHEIALETFIDKDMDKEAEDFCKEQDEDLRLITTLFEIYMKRYIFWNEKCIEINNQKRSSKEFGEANKEKMKYEHSSMGILKKYATHESLV